MNKNDQIPRQFEHLCYIHTCQPPWFSQETPFRLLIKVLHLFPNFKHFVKGACSRHEFPSYEKFWRKEACILLNLPLQSRGWSFNQDCASNMKSFCSVLAILFCCYSQKNHPNAESLKLNFFFWVIRSSLFLGSHDWQVWTHYALFTLQEGYKARDHCLWGHLDAIFGVSNP